MVDDTATKWRGRRRAEAAPEGPHEASSATLSERCPLGGRFRPLTDRDRDLIIDQAFTILSEIGMAGTPDWLRPTLEDKGARLRPDGRLTFGRDAVEKAIGRAAHRVDLPGFGADQGLSIGGGRVHIGTGGAAVQTLDAETGAFRESTLADLHVMMRVLGACPNIHYGVRPLIARDMPDPLSLDINTAYACLRGTSKPIGVSFHTDEHVRPVIGLFDLALGGEGAFRRRPFCMAIVVHVVPPLRFAADGVDIMRAAIDQGMPLQICSAGQAGATAPASLAGALAQGLAECLAGLMVVDALSPGHACIFAFMPFISDLRTGAMSGGGGEAAVASAAAAQLLLYLDLPSTACAGMTDAKIADAQAGYEKGYSIALAAQAGADMINLSVGMLGSIMVASPEALVIDDEMCGAILRSVRGVELRAESLDLEAVERVVTGEGHYLGEAQTLALMKSEYVYPRLGDRSSVDDWLEAGGLSIWDRARARVAEILAADPPGHLAPATDRAIREHFPIKLSLTEMRS
jgi:trimethylamine--corrinoid protein Co-methyltransferase